MRVGVGCFKNCVVGAWGRLRGELGGSGSLRNAFFLHSTHLSFKGTFFGPSSSLRDGIGDVSRIISSASFAFFLVTFYFSLFTACYISFSLSLSLSHLQPQYDASAWAFLFARGQACSSTKDSFLLQLGSVLWFDVPRSSSPFKLSYQAEKEQWRREEATTGRRIFVTEQRGNVGNILSEGHKRNARKKKRERKELISQLVLSGLICLPCPSFFGHSSFSLCLALTPQLGVCTGVGTGSSIASPLCPAAFAFSVVFLSESLFVSLDLRLFESST